MLAIVLVVVVALIPIIGFIMTINHARSALSVREQRWRKGHGLLFWTLIPGALGVVLVLGMQEIIPKTFSLVAIVALGISTSISMMLQKRREG